MNKRIIAAAINKGVINAADAEAYEYALSIFFLTLSGIGSMLIAGALFGRFWESIFFIVFFKLLRESAGGAHSNSAFICYALSLLTFIIIAAVSFATFLARVNNVLFVLLLFSCAVLLRYAPQAHENKPATENETKYYRKRTLVIAGIEVAAILFIWRLALSPVILFYALSAFNLASALVFIKAMQNLFHSKKTQ